MTLNIGHIIPHHQSLHKPIHSPPSQVHSRGFLNRSRPRRSPLHTPKILDLQTPPLPTPTTSIHGTRHLLSSLEKLQYASLRARTDLNSIVTHALNGYTWPNTVEDYHRLMATHDSGWLNSTNITNISELFNSYSPAPLTPHSFLCLSAFFFPQLYTPNKVFTYDNVFNWFITDQARNPLLRDFIYLPINLTGSHWTGIIIDTVKHHLTYYDPLGDYRGECKRALYYTREWLKAEISHQASLGILSITRHNSLGYVGDWTYTHNPGPSPTQTNSFDCGIFYLTTILYHIQGRAPNYHQIHLPQIRQQFTTALLTNTLPLLRDSLSHFDYPLSYVHTTSRTTTYLRQLLPSIPSLVPSPRLSLDLSPIILLDSEDCIPLHSNTTLSTPYKVRSPTLFLSTVPYPTCPSTFPHSLTHPP